MKRLCLLVLGALTLLLVGCGEEDAPDPNVDPTSPATAASTGTTEATAAATSATGTPSTAVSATQSTAGTETPIPAPSEPVTSTYSTPTSELPLVRFETGSGSVELPVEVPPRSEYAIGLSGRTTLEGRGMLFYREDFGQTGFWMRNTHIDLDIAFVNPDGEIVFITTMTSDTDDIHRPDEPYVAAIEATAGWYAEHGVEVGDTVTYLFDLDEVVTD